MVSSPSSLGEVMFLRNGGVFCTRGLCCGFGERKNAGFSRYIDAIDMHLGK